MASSTISPHLHPRPADSVLLQKMIRDSEPCPGWPEEGETVKSKRREGHPGDGSVWKPRGGSL